MSTGPAMGALPIGLASRLVDVPAPRLRRWLRGDTGRGQEPIIHAQLPAVDGQRAVGFLDLLDARFIAYFRHRGFSTRMIRGVMERARKLYGHEHPAALRDLRFRSGLNTIFAEEATEEGAPSLLDLVRHQYAIHEILDRLLDDGIVFGDDGVARTWRPRPIDFPNVVVDPRVAFGKPVLAAALVPTATIARARTSADREDVADEFDIAPELVDEASAFEHALAA